MGHLTGSKEEVYMALAQRLNRNPVGCPVNETLMEILHRIFTVSEAELGSKFPLLPMTLDKISEITGQKTAQLAVILEDMADKGLVVDFKRREETYYMLSPMVVGFFEWTFMRTGDSKLKELADLFDIYFASKEVRQEFFGSNTKMFKAMVYEELIQAVVEKEVLDYEKASEVIRKSGGGSIWLCACRHKASHHGTNCEAPMDVCTSLGGASEWLVRRGFARAATVDELLRNLERTEKYGLVHLADNVLNSPSFICNCCGCCCGVLRTISETNIMSVHPSNFIPRPEPESCIGCGTCADRCPIKAIHLEAGPNGEEIPVIDQSICLGCGVCAAGCPSGALPMERRKILHIPPQNKKEQMVQIALERKRF